MKLGGEAPADTAHFLQCASHSRSRPRRAPKIQDMDLLARRLVCSDAFVAVDKPAGVIVHDWSTHESSNDGDCESLPADDAKAVGIPSLVDQLQSWPEFSGDQVVRVLHRLDKPTSGVLLIGRSTAAAAEVSEALGRASKVYVCLCRGETPEYFKVDRPLRQREANVSNKTSRRAKLVRMRLHASAATQEAVTDFVRLATCCDGRASLLLCLPRTGRYHQIRRHLDGARYQISGDRGAHMHASAEGRIRCSQHPICSQHRICSESSLRSAMLVAADNADCCEPASHSAAAFLSTLHATCTPHPPGAQTTARVASTRCCRRSTASQGSFCTPRACSCRRPPQHPPQRLPQRSTQRWTQRWTQRLKAAPRALQLTWTQRGRCER